MIKKREPSPNPQIEYTVPVETVRTYYVEDTQLKDELFNMKHKIMSEYEKKVKEIEEDAKNKLKLYQLEHQALLDKT